MKKILLMPLLAVALFCVGCGQVQIIDACDKYQQAVGPEVVEYANADGVVSEAEAEILKVDTDFAAMVKTEKGPSVADAKNYSAKVAGPWLTWVDADGKLDSLSKRLRHATKEDFDAAMKAVETGK